MTTIEWQFPDTPETAADLMKKGYAPHSGGTWLMKQKPGKGWVDLSRIESLYRFTEVDGVIEAGAMLTFSSLAEKLSAEHVLARALSAAASNTLRNRITLGGSLAAFPVWSDLAAPLVLLGAEVLLHGAGAGSVAAADYLSDTSLRKSTLVTGIRFPSEAGSSGYFRHTRTTFDYPAFTIAARRTPGGVRAVVSGTKERISIFDPATEHDEPRIPGRFDSSEEYLSHCAAVELGRLVRELTEAAK